MLPKLARLAGAGQEDEFLQALRQIVMIVVAVGVIGIVVGFGAGHTVGRVLFGPKFTLGNRDVGLLAIGSGAFIFALTLAQALIALRSYAASALSWLAGAVGCVIGAAIAHDLFLRSELSFGIGAVFAALLDARVPCRSPPVRRSDRRDEALLTNIEPEPLEIWALYTCFRVKIDGGREDVARARASGSGPAPLGASEAVGRRTSWSSRLRAPRAFSRSRSRPSGPTIAFVCFCLAASSTYCINDAIDVEADRQHPRKRNRARSPPAR